MYNHPNIVFFDGICNLCNQSVQWVIRHDRKEIFRFASLQSEETKQFFREKNYIPTSDSVLLWDGHRFSEKSTAAIKIASKLGFPWSILGIAYVIPAFIRDAVYAFIAARRYKWFGKKDTCMIPSAALRSRFLDASV
jgi:predicted DCC family thiol-disulfide oxidoreductase YuxK